MARFHMVGFCDDCSEPLMIDYSEDEGALVHCSSCHDCAGTVGDMVILRVLAAISILTPPAANTLSTGG